MADHVGDAAGDGGTGGRAAAQWRRPQHLHAGRRPRAGAVRRRGGAAGRRPGVHPDRSSGSGSTSWPTTSGRAAAGASQRRARLLRAPGRRPQGELAAELPHLPLLAVPASGLLDRAHQAADRAQRVERGADLGGAETPGERDVRGPVAGPQVVRHPGARLHHSGGGRVEVEQGPVGQDEPGQGEPPTAEHDDGAELDLEREHAHRLREPAFHLVGNAPSDTQGDVGCVGRPQVQRLAGETDLRQELPLGPDRGIGLGVQQQLDGLHPRAPLPRGP